MNVSVYAQDANEIRQKQMKDNNESLNNVYLNNLPNQKAVGSGSLSAEELEKVAEKLKRATQGNNNYIDSRTEADKARIRKEINDRWYYEKKRGDELIKTYGEMAEEIVKLGFTKHEGYRLARYATLPADGDTKGFDAVNNATNAFVLFNENFDIATYDELVALAQTYKLAGYSCIVSLRKIALRFPERSSELDLLLLNQLPYFYGYKDVTDKLIDFEVTPRAESESVATDFIRLFEQNPIATNNVAFHCIMSPYESYAVRVWMEQNKNKLGDKFLMILKSEDVMITKDDADTYYNASYYKQYYKQDILKLLGCNYYFRKHKTLIKKLTIKDWKEISRAKGIAATDIMPFLVTNGWDRETLRSFSAYKGTKERGYNEFYNLDEGFGFPEMIKELALNGDVAAMNAYGIRIASRVGNAAKIPETEAVEWLVKAARAGYFASVINLWLGFERDITGYDSDENITRVSNEIISYFEAADAETAFRGALTYTEGISWDIVQQQNQSGFIYAKIVLNSAAKKGSTKAIKILNDFPRLKI